MRPTCILRAPIGVVLLAPLCVALTLSSLPLVDVAVAQQGGVDFTLVNGSEAEQRTLAQLERLLGAYDVEAWIFTRDVRIEADVIPHSHPVLTVSTGDPDDVALSAFLHEQFHWYVNEIDDVTEAAKAEFAERFPDAPPGPAEGGARDRNSTYLHLVVCDLELQAMTELVGEQRARAAIESYNHYPWIYEQVLTNPLVREINERHGAVVPER